MGWSFGYDSNWKRNIGYSVEAVCDHPYCVEVIDRGLSYVCGGESYGGDTGCGLFFCTDHLLANPQLCERCFDGFEPFDAKEDIKCKWNHRVGDSSITTECGNECHQAEFENLCDIFIYCPFCKEQIEEVIDDR